MRRKAACALRHLNLPGTFELLVAALEDADPGVARVAAEVLGQRGDRRAAPALGRLVERVVVEFGDNPDYRPPPPQMREVEEEARLGPAIAAGDALRFMGAPDGRDALIRILKEGPAGRREKAVTVLRIVPDPSFAAPLFELLLHDDPAVRAAAIECLGKERGPRMTEAMLGLLASPDAGVRARAAGYLWEHWEPRVVEPIAKLTGDPDPDVRIIAAEALAWHADRRGIEALIATLEGATPRFRAIAAGMLATHDGPGVREALERAAAADAEREVREAARGSLRLLGKRRP
jgi:HEAT repeat protein